MMRLLVLSSIAPFVVLLLASAVNARRPDERTLRALEENGYQYLEDLSQYQMQFGKCIRVKVPDDGDDDGNSYFYNGKYYSQYEAFASVYLCDKYQQGEDHDEDSEQLNCGLCDSEKEYVTDLASYLETTLEYANLMCQSCQAQCRRRRRRRLEDEDKDGEDDDVQYMNVDCSTCYNTCQNMNFNYLNNENGDEEEEGDEEEGNNNNNNNVGYYGELAYLECQEAFVDDQGIQIYAGPQCDSEGDIVIGFYYDEECSVKSSSAVMDFGFEYGTFQGIQNMCLACDPYGNGEDDVCQELYNEATHCSNGRNLDDEGGEDDELPICSTLKKAHREKRYGKRRRNWQLAELMIAIVLVGGLLWGCMLLSWTYFLRHRSKGSKDAKIPLTEADHQHSEPEINVVSTNDVPPVS